jgi:hypothetical protein
LQICVFQNLNRKEHVTEKHTSGVVWRVKIIAEPNPNEFDEYDVRRFRVGDTYDVSARLGTLLILGGYAETAGPFARAEAADSGVPPPKSKSNR